MSPTSARVALAAAAAALLVSPARAQIDETFTIHLQASRDNSLWEEGDLSSGAGERLFAGRTNLGGRRRCLLRFDVSAIPPGAVIEEVRLTLRVSNSAPAPRNVGVHRVLADWGEAGSNAGEPGGGGAPAQPGDATWTHAFFPDVPWTPGGAFVGAASAVAGVGQFGIAEWSGGGLVDDVGAWVAGLAPNHGWILVGDEAAPGTAKRFDSRENANPLARPVLRVRFQAPVGVEPGTWTRAKAAHR